MKLIVVGFAYALWLVAVEVIFYKAGDGNVAASLELAVVLGIVPAALQLLLLGFDPVGLAAPGRLSIVFLLIVLASYLFNGANWSVITYFIEAVYICVMSIMVAGCPDRRLLRTMAGMFSLMSGIFLVYVDFTGEYVWGRLAANGLESNFWGLMALGVAVTAFALPSRLLMAICIGIGYMTMYYASSRSSILGLAVVGLVVGAVHLRDLRNRQLVAAAGFAAAGLALIVILIPVLRELVPAVLDNVMKLNDPYRGVGEGFSGREGLWKAAIDLWLKSPWLGVGFRQHEQYLPLHYSTHDAYLAMLADLGIFGLLWYLALLIGAALAAFGITDTKTRDLTIAMIFGYAVIGTFERRAINAGNPVSLLFMMLCFFSLAQGDIRRAYRRINEAWEPRPSRHEASQV
jgi:O-antigen ligase